MILLDVCCFPWLLKRWEACPPLPGRWDAASPCFPLQELPSVSVQEKAAERAGEKHPSRHRLNHINPPTRIFPKLLASVVVASP